MITTDIQDLIAHDDDYRSVGRSRHDGPCPHCGGDDRCTITHEGGSDGRDLWWCRQCRRGGDVVMWLECEGMTTAEAMEAAGLESSKPSSGGQAVSSASLQAATKRQQARNHQLKQERRYQAVREHASTTELALWRAYSRLEVDDPQHAEAHCRGRERIEDLCMERASSCEE